MQKKVVIFWFRRDLRLQDNTGLAKALASGYPVLPVFIFDTDILNQLEDKYDRRVDYIHQALSALHTQLHEFQSVLHTFYGTPYNSFKQLLEQYNVQAVYCNSDYEPQAIARDNTIKGWLAEKEINFYDYKDQVIFEKNEIVKTDGSAYTVYTPYAKTWRSVLTPQHVQSYTITGENFYKSPAKPIHTLNAVGFKKTDMQFQPPRLDADIIKSYDKYRDYPAMQYTTQLGIALRLGTISIRKCVAFAQEHNMVWLSELIWREFFMQILFHFPHVAYQPFKKQYSYIQWRNNEEEFQLWCQGKTGYAIVDAGMRQLNQTGYMHNRVRMIVASFLCKHLLIDWRWGEAYFAQKLNDYDMAANNGNWQWAAGCGCDAAPYFRIFNPATQTQKFDKDLQYIKTWNPDFEQQIKPEIIAHDVARERVLKAYKKALSQ